MGGDAVEKTQQSIDPRLDEAGGTFLDMLMGQAAINPWDLENTGPRVAAVNQAQKDVMDQTAGAGNAFNMGFTSATEGLPQETMIGGMPAYDTLGLAKQGISPAMQELYSNLYGDNGLMSKYGLVNGQPAGAQGSQGGNPEDPRSLIDMLLMNSGGGMMNNGGGMF